MYSEQLRLANDAVLQLERACVNVNIEKRHREDALTMLIATQCSTVNCTSELACGHAITRQNITLKTFIYECNAFELMNLSEDSRLSRVCKAVQREPLLEAGRIDFNDIISTVAELVPGVHESMNTPFMHLGADSLTLAEIGTKISVLLGMPVSIFDMLEMKTMSGVLSYISSIRN